MSVLDVAIAVRGGYVTRLAPLLASLSVQPVRVHVLHGRLAPWHRPRLRRARLHRVRDEQVAGLPVRDYFTPAMWYRVLLPELLPASDRVLYLDADTLVLGDLAPLAELDLGDALVAAVTNVFEAWRGTEHADRLGLDQASYFNSGVLLLNLRELRRTNAMDELRRVATQRGPELLWPDQDALNLVLGDRRLELHPRWNAMNALYLLDNADEVYGARAACEARADPAIRHFEGPGANKPWDPASTVPHRDAWRARA